MDQLTIIIDDRALSDVELDESALALRRELLELPVHDVQNLPAGSAPPGARVVDVATIGGLLVLLNSSVALLASLVAAINPGGETRSPIALSDCGSATTRSRCRACPTRPRRS